MDHADCHFCTAPKRTPELIIHEDASWYVMHVDQFFPEGSLFLVTKRHGMMPTVTADEWKAGGALFPACSRMLTEIGGADRTYLASYSERNLHFHIAMINKLKAHQEHHEGKFGSLLMAAYVNENKPRDPAVVAKLMKQYRESFPKYLNTANAEFKR